MMIEKLSAACMECSVCGGKNHYGLVNSKGSDTLIVLSEALRNRTFQWLNGFDVTYTVRCSNVDIESASVACGVYTLMLATAYKYVILIGIEALKQMNIDEAANFEVFNVGTRRFLYIMESYVDNENTLNAVINKLRTE